MRRGFLEAFAVTFGIALLTAVALNQLFSNPAQASAALAQISATLLVAYAVQMSWVLQNSRKRGSDRENWVGITTGLGVCAVTGIGVAIALSSHHEPLNWLEGFGFAWAVSSSALLGFWIAVQPWAMYEWTHWFNTEYPDE
jgi:putative flippase GtrA